MLWSARVDIALLNEVSEEFAAYLSEVTDGDLATRTPCTQWTIDDLCHHMLELNIQLGQPSSPPGGCVPRETIYRESARHAADSASAEHAIQWHLTNTVIHTWDLAQALQLDFDPPRPDALEITLNCLRQLSPDKRGPGQDFGAIPDITPTSPMDEILLLSGRKPTCQP